jgi:hypothetical protein
MPKTTVRRPPRKGTKGVRKHSRNISGDNRTVPHSSSKKKSPQVAKVLRLIEKREELLKKGYATYDDKATKVDDQIFKTMEDYDKKIEYWKREQIPLKAFIQESDTIINNYEKILRINPKDIFIRDKYEPLLEDSIKFRKKQQSKLKTIKKRISNYEKAWDKLYNYMEKI